MIKRLQTRIIEALESDISKRQHSRNIDIFLMGLIVLNVFAVIVGTINELASQYSKLLDIFEMFSVAVFSIEYLLRIWVCTMNENYKHPILGRVRFAISPMALVDLFAILPFYAPMMIAMDLRFLRALRLLRLLRLFKLGRYSNALTILANVFKSKREELVITVFVVSILFVMSSSAMYFVEHTAQPEIFSSIPATMWWASTTLTTVGYGDVYPITAGGRFLGAIIAFLGIGLFALPAGIIASGFSEVLKSKQTIQCPHCSSVFHP